jgi:NADPH:quinone reductase
MKAVLCKAFGSPDGLVVEDVPSPPLPDGHVRVAISAVGVNFAEIVQISGDFQIPTELPMIPGFEAVGAVLDAGTAEGLATGDRVLVLTCWGVYAEEAVVPASHVVRAPDGLDDAHAAAFPVAYATAHVSLLHRAQLQPHETVVVHAPTGNVGRAALQVANRIGARVIAVSRRPDEVHASAHAVVDARSEDVVEQVKALTAGRGADVVLELVGGAAANQALEYLAWEGRLLTVGFAGGEIPDVSLVEVLIRNVSVIGEDIAGYAVRDPEVGRRALLDCVRWYEQGDLDPGPVQTRWLEDAAAVLAEITPPAQPGKLALTNGPVTDPR